MIDGVFSEVTGSGPGIVLSHDGLTHSASWDAQFGMLAADYRVARWDRRGYGSSPRPTERYSSIDDLAALARSVSDAPVTLVGCSFGALFSMACAVENPELVAAMVLVGPVVAGLPLSEHFLTRGGRQPAPDAPDAEKIAYVAEVDPWFIAPANTAARQWLRELLTAHPDHLRPPIELERFPEQSLLARLGEIAVPTLILAGEHDIADVHAHSGAIEAAIPGARRVVITGSGHLPHVEVPEEFNRSLLEFLAAVPERQPVQ